MGLGGWFLVSVVVLALLLSFSEAYIVIETLPYSIHSYALVGVHLALALSEESPEEVVIREALPFQEHWPIRERNLLPNTTVSRIDTMVERYKVMQGCPWFVVRAFWPMFVSKMPGCPNTKVFVHGTTEFHVAPPHIWQGKDYRNWDDVDDEVVIVAPSQWAGEGFLASGLARNHLLQVPHGVVVTGGNGDSEEVDEAGHAWVQGLVGECKVVLAVGAMTENKGIRELLEAFAEVVAEKKGSERCVRLVLKGIDSLYQSSRGLKDVLDRLGVEKNVVEHIRIDGSTVPSTWLRHLMRNSVVLAAPYHGEGFALPVLEAVAAGLPVIAPTGHQVPTDSFLHPSIATLLPSTPAPVQVFGSRGWGVVVRKEDLVGAMRQYLSSNSPHYAKEKAIEIASRFSWTSSALQLLAFAHSHTPPRFLPPFASLPLLERTSSNIVIAALAPVIQFSITNCSTTNKKSPPPTLSLHLIDPTTDSLVPIPLPSVTKHCNISHPLEVTIHHSRSWKADRLGPLFCLLRVHGGGRGCARIGNRCRRSWLLGIGHLPASPPQPFENLGSTSNPNMVVVHASLLHETPQPLISAIESTNAPSFGSHANTPQSSFLFLPKRDKLLHLLLSLGEESLAHWVASCADPFCTSSMPSFVPSRRRPLWHSPSIISVDAASDARISTKSLDSKTLLSAFRLYDPAKYMMMMSSGLGKQSGTNTWSGDGDVVAGNVDRVVVMSAGLCLHSVGKAFAGLVVGLSRQFRVDIVAIGDQCGCDVDNDPIVQWLMQSEGGSEVGLHFHPMCELRLDGIIETIQLTFSPHIILFLEVGVEGLTTKIASKRIAKHQVTLWGSPAGEGIEELEIDMILLPETTNTPRTNFEEFKVPVKFLPHTGAWIIPPILPEPAPNFPSTSSLRDAFCSSFSSSSSSLSSLHSCSILFWPHTLAKFGVEVDQLLADILHRVPNTLVLVLEGTGPAWAAAIQRRWLSPTSPMHQLHGHHVRFLPRLSGHDYTAMLRVASAVLDSYPYSSFTIALEALTAQTPILAYDPQNTTTLVRSQTAPGLLRTLGLDHWIASSSAELASTFHSLHVKSASSSLPIPPLSLDLLVAQNELVLQGLVSVLKRLGE